MEEIKTNNVLPFIRKTKRIMSGNGTVIEEQSLIVQGPNLERNKRIFDEEWNK